MQGQFVDLYASADYLGPGAIEIDRYQTEIFDIVRMLNEQDGVSFLLAEQNTNLALQYASYGYILETGRLVMDGEAAALRENSDVREFYLGLSAGDRKSFRDVKSYKRRKRWLA